MVSPGLCSRSTKVMSYRLLIVMPAMPTITSPFFNPPFSAGLFGRTSLSLTPPVVASIAE